MSPGGLGLVVAFCLGVLVSSASLEGANALGRVHPQSSLRSLERLRWDCESPIGRRELTLFGNGTLRVREGPLESLRVYLEELDAERRDAYLRRLVDEDLGEVPADAATVEGDWVEQCTLELELPNREPESYRFGRYDSLSLRLERVVAIARELVEVVDRRGPGITAQELPLDYAPKTGDVLERADGLTFRIESFTVDGSGIELHGIEQPLAIYVLKDELRKHFVRLVRRWRE